MFGILKKHGSLLARPSEEALLKGLKFGMSVQVTIIHNSSLWPFFCFILKPSCCKGFLYYDKVTRHRIFK